MNSFVVTIQYFITIMAELIVLFIGISTIIAFLLMYIPQNKIKDWLSGKGILGNIMAVLFGAVTPFCACSTVPMTLGLLEAGVSFGTVMSFVISSPLMDPLVFILLGTFMGWKVAIGFLVLTSIFAVIFGLLFDKFGWADQVKRVRIKGGKHEHNGGLPIGFKNRLKASLLKAWTDFKGVFIYMVIGVAIGAAIYGYMPTELLAKVAGPDNPFAVIVLALIGMPLYIRVESAIPIGLSLINKGASIGAVIAFIISGAGIAIPELTMLSSIFKKKIIIAFVVIVFVTSVISGFVFNMLI
ncbi:MAG: permease [Clostridium sp.]|uniref:Putative permease n=1 Tax=Clostridium coskatii TaxID=1705578 RepID=A0A166T6H5_9CLOT|nr:MULTISPECIES: permease [Clostridium]MCH3964612.1 permease [Clostridium sp.]MCH4198573.1 permease [Clostridium tyrobutyricum]MCH4258892.1 permease [Clostridium tyrobutyricum]MCI1239760.1 permease [Clostridium tyrobutyricum]MCI1651458.1 permease [Clostridium tyrobutyricum]